VIQEEGVTSSKDFTVQNRFVKKGLQAAKFYSAEPLCEEVEDNDILV
jgi:hypothetical protein